MALSPATTRPRAAFDCPAGIPYHPAHSRIRGPAGDAAHAQHLLGDIATHPDRFDAENGELHYLKAQALTEQPEMRPLVAHCHLGLGELRRRTGRQQESREHLTAATTMYHQIDGHDVLDGAGGGGGEGVAMTRCQQSAPGR